jgi:8-oxo-dGTP pyrophosphatase MutT (NUDIX family)
VKIDLIREKFANHVPACIETSGHQQAAVALVFKTGDRGTEVLLIERALKEGDPWSGHMAFPGGRIESVDDSTRSAACRETLEEVGVELTSAEYLGRLDDLAGHPRVSAKLVIAAHAFFVEASPPMVLDSSEVQDVIWFPLASLLDESRWVEHAISELPDVRFPGVLVGQPGRHVVWGLTYRFLEGMLQILEHPLPRRWGDESYFDDF